MRLAFVIPWYGEDIRGGAEMELRELSTHLQKGGAEIEILTTCVRSFDSNWNENYYAEGTALVYGVPTRRFPVRQRDSRAFDRVNAKLMQGKEISLREEKVFLREMINSTALCDYIREHADEYDLFIFMPYMFGTTYAGIKACPPEKAILLPCLHNEAYAKLQLFRQTYIHVHGMLFNSRPEMELANKLFDMQSVRQACIGIGMDTGGIQGNALAFREKYNIQEPFILYAGRKDSGKNVDLLLQYFTEYRKNHPESDLSLVLIGGGSIGIPRSIRESVRDLGYVSPEDKYNAQTAAAFLCQPSKNESFSIVMMESWLCGRPVLVHGKCPVTTDFVRRSSGGLYFTDYCEFEGCVNWLMANPEKASLLGENGRAFVKECFDWKIVTETYLRYFQYLIEQR